MDASSPRHEPCPPALAEPLERFEDGGDDDGESAEYRSVQPRVLNHLFRPVVQQDDYGREDKSEGPDDYGGEVVLEPDVHGSDSPMYEGQHPPPRLDRTRHPRTGCSVAPVPEDGHAARRDDGHRLAGVRMLHKSSFQ